MKTFLKQRVILLFFSVAAMLSIAGCGLRQNVEELVYPERASSKQQIVESVDVQDYYDKFFQETTRRTREQTGVTPIKALDALPKDPEGRVNWTAAVVQGMINPRGSLDPNVEEEPPLKLNIFIEAKVPLMANVIFPHSIHTYWLSCKNCHPKIFLPEAGANAISMEEIFKGEWCGRCHGKVAFNFWPRENCLRCHMILKGFSLEKEKWR